MMLFAPLDFAHGHTRADRHRAARLALLRGRMLKRMRKLDDAADEVEQAAMFWWKPPTTLPVEAFRDAMCSSSSAAFAMPVRGERSPSSG
ncbi:hypothetical protein RFM98_00400 [Mesorhizobium sp. VK9D]|uniref:hypothetical protein n=1 Tax=Mesorhizobium australafricanum TaxID=3072311 RepID=UPI002A247370|nr:hypothetical protein [Mesorhizobium sp. VK9D]MDX8451207.1 hypothetical protein [Mesorhizobium sp. VK9D]